MQCLLLATTMKAAAEHEPRRQPVFWARLAGWLKALTKWYSARRTASVCVLSQHVFALYLYMERMFCKKNPYPLDAHRTDARIPQDRMLRHSAVCVP